jgi:hypothetical protein
LALVPLVLACLVALALLACLVLACQESPQAFLWAWSSLVACLSCRLTDSLPVVAVC